MKPTFSYFLCAAAAVSAITLGWLNLTQPDSKVSRKAPARANTTPREFSRVADRPKTSALRTTATRCRVEIKDDSMAAPVIAAGIPSLSDQVNANWESIQTRRTYADFLESLGLDPAEEELFLKLISSRYVGETAEDEDNARKTEVEIQKMLGSNWQAFIAYEEQMEDRIYVMQCDEVMLAHNASLNSQQRKHLIALMAKAGSPGISRNPESGARSELESHTEILRCAEEILEPRQLQPFREALRMQEVARKSAFESDPEALESGLLLQVNFPAN